MGKERDIWKEWFKEMDFDAPKDGNIWGWKWTKVSLVIILIGLFFVFVIGPKEETEKNANETEKMTVIDSLNSKQELNN